MQVESFLVDYRDIPDLDPQKSLPQQAFIHLAKPSISPQTTVLDIGAGHARNWILHEILGDQVVVDGVDVDPRVLENSSLRKRWHEPFETSSIPPHSYQTAFAYNVLEHIKHPQQFMSKVAEVLQPGGVFWAYTPNANHPFSRLARAVELSGAKGRFAESNQWINDYPSYYRLNSARAIERAARGLPFEKGIFYHLYAPGWQTYFPRRLRWIARSWDVATRRRSTAVLAFCMYRAND